MKLLAACLLLTAMARAQSQDSWSPKNCPRDYKIIGLCFKVHGRLRQMAAGPPSQIIWPIGSKRLLGVDEEDANPNLTATLQEDVYADFVVCPLTKSKPGVMQRVCVKSVKNQVRKREPED